VKRERRAVAKETARCRSSSFRCKVRRQHSIPSAVVIRRDYKWYSTASTPCSIVSIVGFGKYEHITPVLCDVFHWLPVHQRIQFKIAALTFDCVRGTGPAYFSSIVCTVTDNSGRPGLRLAERGDLFVQRTRTTRLGGGAFTSYLQLTAALTSLPVHQSQ